MALKDIVGLLTLHDREGQVSHQGSNISFRYGARYQTIYSWNNIYAGTAPAIGAVPWKMGGLLADDDVNIGHDLFFRGPGAVYPADPAGAQIAMGSPQYNFFRLSGSVGTIATANVPRVFGSVAAYSRYPGIINGVFGRGDSLLSQVDLPLDYTQIGIVYFHPAHQQANTVSTTAGLSYVTYTASSFWDQLVVAPGAFSLFRIETGADAGYYFVQSNDTSSNRLYLRCLDGSIFNAIATASNLTATAGPGRRAWFNEVSVIPLSVGSLETSGRYNPRKDDLALRESYILRLTIDKSGSTEAASGTEQQGSYLVSLKPYTHGEGSLGTAIPDDRSFETGTVTGMTGNDTLPSWWVNFSGGCNGIALDWENQRLWFGTTNSSNQSSLFHWRYKTTESFREVANYLGTAGSASFLTPTPVLGAGDIITDVVTGSTTGSAKNWTYVTIYHASGGNAGVLIIKPDLTTFQYNTGSGVPSSLLAGSCLDRSRMRVGTTGDVTTTVGTNQLNSASASFTDADIGRVIKVTGATNDNASYKIATRASATQVTVTTTAGGAVSFTGGTGGTFEIGDRLYLFFNNGTTGAGKINYMESMAPGVFHTRTVTMTNGATINTRVSGGTGLVYGQRTMCCVDAPTGDVYWLSNDTQQQINKYAVATNTHSLIAIGNTSLLSPAGGVVVGGTNPATNPGTPTVFTAIHANSKFDDLWVGSNTGGHFRITKSTFAASSTRRYFGAENGTYLWGAPLTTGTGNGTTGLTFSTPNVTINASGTPFTANDVGKYIVITGSTSANNHGAFLITAFNSTSSVTFTNSLGVAQASYAGTFYVVAAPIQHTDGSNSANTNSRFVRSYYESLDGRQYGFVRADASAPHDLSYFSQEADTWAARGGLTGSNSVEAYALLFAPDGRYFTMLPTTSSSNFRYALGALEIEYQWDNANSKWIPKEWIRTSVPNKSVSDSTSPNCKARPIHSTYEDVLFGVKVRWNRQGGATPPNNEFLGRGGQSRTTASDGSTTSGSSTFGGSSFSAGDVGKLLRIESGADASVYKISAFITAASVTLQRMNGLAWSATATAGTLTYTVWELGTPGSNAGPENVTILLADGFGKDNTQDLTGITYESFGFKTRFSENFEGRKHAVDSPLAIPGALDTKVYFETYARATPQYDAALSHHRALPGAEATLGRQLCDWMQDKFLDGTGLKATLYSSPSNVTDWNGIVANTAVMGASVMVDLGKNIEIGYVQIRTKNYAFAPLVTTNTNHGLIANLYMAPDGSTPAASSTIRLSGTSNINVSGANVTTVTVSSGDFLGAITTGPLTNGAITAGQNTFVAPAATFVAGDRLKILKITAGAGADIGSYRITAVSPDGSTLTIRNLDQTAKAWVSSASGITYEVRNGLQEEDMIAIPSLGAPTHRLCVERLLSATSFQARTAANASVSNQSWDAVVPSWSLVKRMSFNTEASPPDVKNNGTWVSLNGRNNNDSNDTLQYFDLTDLPAAQRTGRWWKWSGIPRFAGDTGSDAAFHFSTFEFYSPSGAKLAVSKYTSTDQAQTNADFYFSYLNRVDFIQSANDALTGVAGFNGTVDLGGANGDTLTLNTGGNKFLGFQVKRPFTDGTTTSPDVLNSATAVWTTADVGRFVRFTSGTYSGNFYRIASRVSATQVTLVTPSGGAAGLATDAGPMNFTVHEGIAVGGTNPDKFALRRMGAAGDVTTTIGTNQFNSPTGAFTSADIGKFIKVTGATADNGVYLIKTFVSATQVTVTSALGEVVSFAGGTGGTFEVDSDLREYTLSTINDALTTLTISESLQLAVTNRRWEIRRAGYDTSSATTEATKLARIVRPQSTYPVQSGDVAQDSRGHYRFFAEDVGNGFSRADGSIAGGTGVFTGTNFIPDDVGRLLYIDTGTNKGIYEISVYTSATSITVRNHYTGAAVVLTADAGPVTYRILGDRRVRLAKYCTGLRA